MGRRRLVKSFWCTTLSNREALGSQQRDTLGPAESEWTKRWHVVELQPWDLLSEVRQRALELFVSSTLRNSLFQQLLEYWDIQPPNEASVDPDPGRKKALDQPEYQTVSAGRWRSLPPSWLQPQQESPRGNPLALGHRARSQLRARLALSGQLLQQTNITNINDESSGN